jgi:hypothetical protein
MICFRPLRQHISDTRSASSMAAFSCSMPVSSIPAGKCVLWIPDGGNATGHHEAMQAIHKGCV